MSQNLYLDCLNEFDETYRFICYFIFGSCLQQTAYIDVCDDTSYAFRAKSLQAEALAANVPAITTAGIYPGVSNGGYI